jgi:hypothetical protein
MTPRYAPGLWECITRWLLQSGHLGVVKGRGENWASQSGLIISKATLRLMGPGQVWQSQWDLSIQRGFVYTCGCGFSKPAENRGQQTIRGVCEGRTENHTQKTWACLYYLNGLTHILTTKDWYSRPQGQSRAENWLHYKKNGERVWERF